MFCRKHSNNVARQGETLGKATVFVVHEIYFVVRHNSHVVLEVTLFHDHKTSRYCNRCMFSLSTVKCYDMLHRSFCICQVYCKTFIP